MQWELKQADNIEATLDDSGVYVFIHRVVEHTAHKGYVGDIVRVRADLMATDGDSPIVSFIGSANNVRKHLIGYLWHHTHRYPISTEHASYIGYELLRAETDPRYVQD